MGTGDDQNTDRSLAIADGYTLNISGDVVNDSAALDVYQITVESQASVVIGGESRDMSFLVETAT